MANCKSCGATIFWHKTKEGKRMPVDEKPAGMKVLVLNSITGELEMATPLMPHHATCPDADEWRRK